MKSFIQKYLLRIALLLTMLAIGVIGVYFGYHVRAEDFGGISYFDELQKKEKWQTNPFNFIAHAGGGIEGILYTNSLEAVMLSIQKGYRLIEIDLCETSDGHLVGVHDWKHFKKICQYPQDKQDDTPLSLEEFSRCKIHNKFTPIDAKKIEEIFTAHSHLFLVTDKIQNFDLIRSSFSFQDRIIVEIFGKKKYHEAVSKGIVHPMLSAHNPRRDVYFIERYNVKFVAYDLKSMQQNKETLTYLYKKGVTIFVYTANDEKILAEALGNYASAFYTDSWDLSKH